MISFLSRPAGIVVASAPGYAGLFIISLYHSLAPLTAGRVPSDLGYGSEASPALQFLQIICCVHLFAVYGLVLVNWRRLQLPTRGIGLTALALSLAGWSMLPIDSSDTLEYIGFGRIAAVYHRSPYEHAYSEFDDEFSKYVTWNERMPYGPVVLPVLALAGLISAYHPIVAVLALKTGWLLIHLVNAWLLYRIAALAGRDPGYAVALFAFSPLLLIEQLGNGHNDGLLIFFCLVAVLAMQQRRCGLAIVLALLCALVKLPGLFWLGGVMAVVVAQRQWRSLAGGTAAAAAIMTAVYMLIPGSVDPISVMGTQWQFADDSLHTVLIQGFRSFAARWQDTRDYDDVFRLDRIIFTPLFVAICAWRYWLIEDVMGMIREVGAVLLILLLGYAVSVYPWYFTWLLPIAALTESGRLRRTILVGTAATLTLYAYPFALVDGPGQSAWAAVRLVLAFGVPIVFWWVSRHSGAPGRFQPAVATGEPDDYRNRVDCPAGSRGEMGR